MRIDAHVHVVPDDYREVVTSRGLADVAMPRAGLDSLRAMMGRHEIDSAVISLAPPGVAFGDDELAGELARMVNESFAAMREGQNLAALAVLPLPDVDRALRELAFALDDLELDGVLLYSNVNGIYLGDPRWDPVMAELDRRAAYVFIHPAAPPYHLPLADHPGWLYEFPYDTTRAVVNLIYSGSFDRYTRAAFVLAHLGGATPFLAGRIDSLRLREPARAERAASPTAAYLQHLYYDTGLSDFLPALEAVAALAGPGQILFGTDWPYAALPPDGAPQPALEFFGADRAAIEGGNLRRLLPRLAIDSRTQRHHVRSTGVSRSRRIDTRLRLLPDVSTKPDHRIDQAAVQDRSALKMTSTTPSNTSRSRGPARAEHVGSLLRPQALLDEIQRVYEPGHTALLEEERRKDLTALRAAEDAAIERIVSRQADLGIDVMTDGEFRRWMFTNSFYDAIEGISASPNKLAFRADDGTVVEHPGPPVITGRLRKIASPGATEAAYMRTLTTRPFKVTFPAASWNVVISLTAPAVAQKVYESREQFVGHATDLSNELLRDAIEQGAPYVQLDEPGYIFLIDEQFQSYLGSLGVDSGKLLAECVDADTRVLQGLPPHVTTSIHFCRGNLRSRYMLAGSIEPVAEAMFALPYDRFLIEWEDVARDGDYSALRYVPRGGPIVVMGLVSSKRGELETEDDIVRELERASKYIPIEQLAVSPQCGFASGLSTDGTLDAASHGNELTEDMQWRKLELLVRVADRVWGS